VGVALAPPLIGLFSLARLGRSARPVADPARLELLNRLCGQVGLRRRVRLVQSPRRSMPMIWGFFRPTLLMPDDAGTWPEATWRAVLRHELEHVRRWDCLTGLLARVACALHWFNPLAWLALEQARSERERACDDRVLGAGEEPSDYAEQLLMIASGGRSRVFPLAVALAMAAPSRIEQRLCAILDPRRSRRGLTPGRLGLAAVLAAVCTGVLAPLGLSTAAAQAPPGQGKADGQDELAPKDPAELIATVRRHYIKVADEADLRHGALKGLIDALHDPYSEYFDPRQAAQFLRQVEGNLTGIGAMLEVKDGKPVVRGVLPDSPASKAGLKAGDVIVEVDGKPTEGVDLNQIVSRIVGPAGSVVRLMVQTGEVQAKQEITRAAIRIETVRGFVRGPDRRWSFRLDPGHQIGYVQIGQFSPTTEKDVTAALEGLKVQGLKGLVLDLRDCPGGMLDAALSCVKLFLAKGKIISIRGRDQVEKTFEAGGEAPWADLPLVLLVNGQTRSAAEIVSGALRDNGRAVLVGTRTFGKGSVQTVISLKDDQGAVKLTTAYYYLPGGRNIDRENARDAWGVDPTDGDYVPIDAKQADARLQRREVRSAGGVKALADVTPERLAADESDPQLAAALKALIAKTTQGEFITVGQPDGGRLARDDRVGAVRKRREALLDDLKKVERELEELNAKPQP
jgi:carboxyl-terminal processing protease